MGSGQASFSSALLLNEWLGKVPDTDALRLGSRCAGKDLGVLEQGAGPPVTYLRWHELDSSVAPATQVDGLLPQITSCGFTWTHCTSLHRGPGRAAPELPSRSHARPVARRKDCRCDAANRIAFWSSQEDAGSGAQRAGGPRPKLWSRHSHQLSPWSSLSSLMISFGPEFL
ncbi:hypothetical protein HJG60_008795 [Phyllostomus discolor]|uniref:Uncharacterized protein n=1 Tax=Phyllostomus discolor TaxID=89673 RepID=A0A834DIX6_9CHIR|nr:hypothetical protein HJG60_008795 [Phyllostomus discolor]